MPKKALIIGLGICIIPRAFDIILMNVQIDVIEIDAEILRLAVEFFYLKFIDFKT